MKTALYRNVFKFLVNSQQRRLHEVRTGDWSLFHAWGAATENTRSLSDGDRHGDDDVVSIDA